ncbi:MAG: hypothetical protein CR972_02825 [Candidatus Moraniibacteriota bacterium]|nr:MAG: hypothetical protein CR972_02825 [Candidatus Moranbacteria bacterium]
MNNVEEQKSADNIQEIIVKEFGFEDLTDESQKELIERMTESVIKRVLVDAYAKLSESNRKEFEEMMENIEEVEPDSIDGFLREKLTDYDGIIQEAVSDLKKHISESTSSKE